jgi:HPr kinase/phosphorylase
MDKIRFQGVLVKVMGLGILLTGPTGCGKSLAALKLAARGHIIVADDLVEITRDQYGLLTGQAVDPNKRVEVRGVGIWPVDVLFPHCTLMHSPVDLMVDLEEYVPQRDSGRFSPETSIYKLLGAEIPRVSLPITSRSDLDLMIEILVKALRHEGRVPN